MNASAHAIARERMLYARYSVIAQLAEIFNARLRPMNFFLNSLRPQSHKFWAEEAYNILQSLPRVTSPAVPQPSRARRARKARSGILESWVVWVLLPGHVDNNLLTVLHGAAVERTICHVAVWFEQCPCLAWESTSHFCQTRWSNIWSNPQLATGFAGCVAWEDMCLYLIDDQCLLEVERSSRF